MQPGELQTIICIGDSIANGFYDSESLGWFGRLSRQLSRQFPYMLGFNNLAMSGDRTADVYHRLCGEVLSRNPDILFIASGVNDTIRWFSTDGEADTSHQLQRELWANLLNTAKKNVRKVIVVGLLPVVENRFPQPGFSDLPLYHTNADIESYNKQIREWCTERQITFLDIFKIFGESNLEKYFHDASHPNDIGHQIIADYIYRVSLDQIRDTALGTRKDCSWSLPTVDRRNTIYGIVNYTSGADTSAHDAVFIVHGLTSHANEYYNKIAAKRFCELGYDVYRINLYGFEPDARQLQNCTLEIHASDVNVMLNHFGQKYRNIFMIGHSYGAPTLMISKSNLTSIRALSLWDPSFNLSCIIQNWGCKKVGEELYVVTKWNFQFLISAAMVKEASEFDSEKCLQLSAKCPYAIQVIHPSLGIYVNDEISWHSRGQAQNERIVIDGAGHCFEQNQTIEEAISKTHGWFMKHAITDPLK